VQVFDIDGVVDGHDRALFAVENSSTAKMADRALLGQYAKAGSYGASS